jgi:hypothetical protein
MSFYNGKTSTNFLFRYIVSRIAEEEGLDPKSWSNQVWSDLIIEIGDLADDYIITTSANYDESEGHTDEELVKSNVLDGLRFLGLLKPTGREAWYDGKDITANFNTRCQKYAAK